MEGISIQGLEKAAVLNPTILKPGITMVTRYKAMAEDAHLKNPKVTKLMGRRRMLMIGLTRREEATRPKPARRRVTSPCSKISPEAI
jgi:hypothetical protein